MKKVWMSVLVIFVVMAMVIIGCSKKKNIELTAADIGTPVPAGTATITQTNTPYNGTPTFTATATEISTVPPPPMWPAGWIDDCEDTIAPNENEFHLLGPGPHVGGYWITYDDNSIKNNGTSYVWPMSQPWSTRKGMGMTPAFQMSQPGYPGSTYNIGTGSAVRVTGYVTMNTPATRPPGIETVNGYIYGFFGFGTQLTPTAGEPYCEEVDITPYQGIKFWVKGDGFANAWSVKLPFSAQNGNCDGTLTATPSSLTGDDEYKLVFTAPTTWTQKTVAFSTLTQEGWGTGISVPDGRFWKGCSATVAGTSPASYGTCPMSVVKQHVKQIQFQTNGQALGTIYPAAREMWIDDIQLY